MLRGFLLIKTTFFDSSIIDNTKLVDSFLLSLLLLLLFKRDFVICQVLICGISTLWRNTWTRFHHRTTALATITIIFVLLRIEGFRNELCGDFKSREDVFYKHIVSRDVKNGRSRWRRVKSVLPFFFFFLSLNITSLTLITSSMSSSIDLILLSNTFSFTKSSFISVLSSL